METQVWKQEAVSVSPSRAGTAVGRIIPKTHMAGRAGRKLHIDGIKSPLGITECTQIFTEWFLWATCLIWSRKLQPPLGCGCTTDPGMMRLATANHSVSSSQCFPSQRRIIIYPGILVCAVGTAACSRVKMLLNGTTVPSVVRTRLKRPVCFFRRCQMVHWFLKPPPPSNIGLGYSHTLKFGNYSAPVHFHSIRAKGWIEHPLLVANQICIFASQLWWTLTFVAWKSTGNTVQGHRKKGQHLGATKL